MKNRQHVLVHVDQFKFRIKSQNFGMEEELENEEQERINDFDNETAGLGKKVIWRNKRK